MPGLNQLKKFSEDMKDIGDEAKIRAQRGEKSPKIPFPENISEDDDSDAFLLGMPEVAQDEAAAGSGENADSGSVFGDEEENPSSASDFENADNRLSDNSLPDNRDSDSQVPDLDSFFVPQNENGGEVPDLSDFMDDIPLSEPKNENTDFGAENLKNDEENKADENSTPIEDFDLDDLLSGVDLSSSENADSDDSSAPVSDENLSSDSADLGAENLDSLNLDSQDLDSSSLDSLNLDDFDIPADSENKEKSEDPDEKKSGEPDFDFGNLKFDLTSGDENPLNTDFASPENASEAFEDKNSENNEPEKAKSEDSTSVSPESFSLETDSSGSQESLDLTPNFAASEALDSADSADSAAGGNNLNAENSASANETVSSESSSGFDSLPDIDDDLSVFDTSGLDSFDSGSGEIPDASLEVPGDDSVTPASEIKLDPNIENSDDGGADSAEKNSDLSEKTESAENTDVPPEIFDTSEMDGMDFTPKSSETSENEFPVTGESPNLSDDFELDDSFSIPGFSDTDMADLSKKTSALDSVDSRGKGQRPRNTLTDEEYEQFRKNLSDYPLNLRLAVEDFIAKNEFKDDAVFEIIEKILKKTSARQLATQLEKLLDISINIPRDYERRSFAQYEAYKQSFQYTLKNRIIPVAITALILCFVCFGLFRAAQKFIYEPVMASINYKQGYALLEDNNFPQSEDKFNEAVSHKPVKKWFFKYAEGYRSKKQYERAAKMYKNTLRFFNHDIEAGIQYAQMELYDRANYEQAEEIVKREILDYHINDPRGLLLLGDVFLEWAEVDDSKYELAKNQYVELIQRYGENLLYLSRMLRYYIRMDKLRDVLNLKNHFYPNVKSLSSDDWTELSGYLLEKLYGKLSRNDEYLRSYIEDVRSMLEIAVSSNPQNPVAHYNLARYFVNTGYSEQAKAELEQSLDLFDVAKIRTRKNIYREINASRILGEIYAGNREYLKAQEVYTRGADLYNEEHEAAGFEGDENTGKLFADLGDIDYFISGETDSALYNYEKATQIKNDTPSVNYRIGAIYYGKGDYENALSSFIKVHDSEPNDPNILLSLGNTLSLRDDNFTAQSYYKTLLSSLNFEKAQRKILLPQEDADEGIIVDLYLKASNNLGVALYKVARQTGNSQMNAESMVRFADSMKAWDALTRNPRTMVRMEGGNLAEQNSKYITHSYPEFEPAIYTEIPKILSDEKMLE